MINVESLEHFRELLRRGLWVYGWDQYGQAVTEFIEDDASKQSKTGKVHPPVDIKRPGAPAIRLGLRGDV